MKCQELYLKIFSANVSTAGLRAAQSHWWRRRNEAHIQTELGAPQCQFLLFSKTKPNVPTRARVVTSLELNQLQNNSGSSCSSFRSTQQWCGFDTGPPWCSTRTAFVQSTIQSQYAYVVATVKQTAGPALLHYSSVQTICPPNELPTMSSGGKTASPEIKKDSNFCPNLKCLKRHKPLSERHCLVIMLKRWSFAAFYREFSDSQSHNLNQ